MRLFIALFALTNPIVAQHPGPVVISELMWSGSSASSADEWIELYKRSNATVDLSGWTLTRGSDDAIMFVLETGSIAAGGVFLIANYAADHEKSRLAAHPHHVTTAVSLPNTTLLLRLYGLDPLADRRLVDTADDGRGAPLGWRWNDKKGDGAHDIPSSRRPTRQLGDSDRTKRMGCGCQRMGHAGINSRPSAARSSNRCRYAN